MTKKTVPKIKVKVAKPTGKIFKIRNKEYLVTKENDDIKVYLNDKLVFDKFKSKLSFIEWLKREKL